MNGSIGFLGAGYVGLVSGACFASLGHRVLLADINEAKIKALENGEIPIYEPGLAQLVDRCRQSGKLGFTTSVSQVVAKCRIIFICVGTPMGAGGQADLSYVRAAYEDIARHLKSHRIFVNKSTVPVGSGAWVAGILREAGVRPNLFDVVSNPEFLREGNAVYDFMNPDRIVVGSDNPRAAQEVAGLYLPLRPRILQTDLASAELIKYASNAFLATKISFINEVANLCETVGANIDDVSTGMGLDGRIGRGFLSAGPGFGGSCFPKDTQALLHIAQDAGSPMKVVQAVVAVNHHQRRLAVEKLKRHLPSLKGKTVALLGLAFKANTDDIRESPALDILGQLLKEGATVRVYDPEALVHLPKKKNAFAAASAEAALTGADAAVIATEWPEFKAIAPATFARLLKKPLVVDARNLLDPTAAQAAGLTLEAIGRRAVKKTNKKK